MEIIWTPSTHAMQRAQYQSDFLTFIKYQNQYKCEKMFIDESQFSFKGYSTLHDWLSGVLAKHAEYHAKKVAIIVNEDVLHRRSVRKMVNNADLRKVNTKLFNNREEAKNYLLGDKTSNFKLNNNTLVSSLLSYK
ncbi:MAG: hypothetical protein CMO01_17130 [Thalassobius sp.]|nr:hypothetical protein [Thalassovita sp.]